MSINQAPEFDEPNRGSEALPRKKSVFVHKLEPIKNGETLDSIFEHEEAWAELLDSELEWIVTTPTDTRKLAKVLKLLEDGTDADQEMVATYLIPELFPLRSAEFHERMKNHLLSSIERSHAPTDEQIEVGIEEYRSKLTKMEDSLRRAYAMRDHLTEQFPWLGTLRFSWGSSQDEINTLEQAEHESRKNILLDHHRGKRDKKSESDAQLSVGMVSFYLHQMEEGLRLFSIHSDFLNESDEERQKIQYLLGKSHLEEAIEKWFDPGFANMQQVYAKYFSSREDR